MFDQGATYYEVLDLPRNATPESIKRRYRELARRYHPDVAKTADAGEKFRAINEAYRVLSDPERRKNYDAEVVLSELRGQRTRPVTDYQPPFTQSTPRKDPAEAESQRRAAKQQRSAASQVEG